MPVVKVSTLIFGRVSPCITASVPLLRARGGERRLEDLRVGAAPAEVPARRGAYVVERGRRRAREERRAAHHHPRRAQAALERVVFDERGLDRVKGLARGE